MGGLGSGRWERSHRKATVEESLSLGIGAFRDRLHSDSAGWIIWTFNSEKIAEASYVITRFIEGPRVIVSYRWQEWEDVSIEIRFQSTPTNFNGHRIWFTCPLVVDDNPCNRRLGKLYLPPAARYFGCRKCHDLAYESSQKAHHFKRLPRRLASMQRFVERKRSVSPTPP